MLKQNSELRAQAREALRGKWPMAAVAALIYSVIAGGLSAIPLIGGLCSLFVGLPVAYGFTIVMVTHNANIAEMANTVIRMNSGEIAEIYANAVQKSAYEIGW